MHSHKSQSQKAFLLIATLFHLYIIDKMDKVEESEVGQICMSSRIVRNLWCTFSLVQLVESSRSIPKIKKYITIIFRRTHKYYVNVIFFGYSH